MEYKIHDEFACAEAEAEGVAHPVYWLHWPERVGAPVILSAPHGGRELEPAFLAAADLDEEALLATLDVGTAELVLKQRHFPAIAARFARCQVDLNRPRGALDPALIDLPRVGIPENARAQIDGGYGVIPRFAAPGRRIRSGKMCLNEAQGRLERLYDPFHNALAELLDRVAKHFGRALLLDIHSAPGNALGSIDIQTGSRYGTTLCPRLHDKILDIFEGQGFRTRRETPFAGGHITSHYADHVTRIECLQIEINRDLLGPGYIGQFHKSWGEFLIELPKAMGAA